ncbi:MAG: ComEC/Rec2 family competence protein [Paludibacteraceae bacterium]|nr:ComEC/Rec2 family competence protein [Paludibacteraceae bacterium]
MTAALVAGILSYRCCPAGEISLLFFGLGAAAMGGHWATRRLPVATRWSWRWLFGMGAACLLIALGRTVCELEYNYIQNVCSSQNGQSVLGDWVGQLREGLGTQIGRYTSGETQALLRALLLGDKSGLSVVQRDCFRQAGCAHILAVSGLHVGIVYGALRAVCRRPCRALGPRLAQVAVQLAGLWAYATICGLPPSVVRSALMFSVIAVGYCFEQRPDTCNSVFFSAFLLLLYRPSYLYDIGFQLSYTAVIGILAFAGEFQRLVEPLTWLGRQLLSLEAVSLAAQMATAPLCLYYFHSFPIYFPISNLLAVPAATAFVYLGIGLLAGGLWPVVGQTLGWLLDQGYQVFFGLLSDISHLPYATLKISGFGMVEACWLALLLVSAHCCLFRPHKQRWLCLHLGTLCVALTTGLARDLVLLLA